MTHRGYLGIDLGTQGLSVILTDPQLNVLALGEGSYDMVPELGAECYEQRPEDWIEALRNAMNDLRGKLPANEEIEVLAIGISGQMHGETLADENGQALGSARLWCDSRNEAEGHELTQHFGTKMPKRATASRWLWTMRNQPDKAARAKHMTTPAGWIAYQLTGEWRLGIGDASGMFPIDQETLDYDQERLARYDERAADTDFTSLSQLLPQVRKAGEDGGTLNQNGSELLGLPVGIPVAPAEGDQPAAMAGSLIGQPGMVSISFGTSVCANSVGDRPFQGVSPAVDHFCAVDGKPINMVWLRNGTTFMNSVVQMFADILGPEHPGGFASVISRVLEAAPDCGGLLALPFMDDEPGLEVAKGGTALVVGLTAENATAGNVVKAALLSTMFNLKLGSEVLDAQGYPRTQLVLTGGLTKTPELAQLLADVFNTPVTLLESAEEGTAWGAALMAKYRLAVIEGSTLDWPAFLATESASGRRDFQPDPATANIYQGVYDRYKKLVATEAALASAVNS